MTLSFVIFVIFLAGKLFKNRPFCYLRDYKIALCRLTPHTLLSC